METIFAILARAIPPAQQIARPFAEMAYVIKAKILRVAPVTALQFVVIRCVKVVRITVYARQIA